jgi:hypothetical protein
LGNIRKLVHLVEIVAAESHPIKKAFCELGGQFSPFAQAHEAGKAKLYSKENG